MAGTTNVNMQSSADTAVASPQLAQLQQSLQGKDDYLNQRLRTWFKDPQAFRSVQAACDALIFGSCARSFFTRTIGEEGDYRDLSIAINHTYLEEMRTFLETDGYVTDRNPDAERKRLGIAQLCMYAHVIYQKTLGTHLDTIYLRVVIYFAVGRPNTHTILNAALTTADLNFISWNKAYSMLPIHTFVNKHAYLLHAYCEVYEPTLKTLHEEGFRVKGLHWNQRMEGLLGTDDSITRHRRVGDQWTWVVDLNTDGVTPSATPDSVGEMQTFRIRVEEKGKHVTALMNRYEVHSNTYLNSPLLQHRYSFWGMRRDGSATKPTTHYACKIEELKMRLIEATYLEIRHSKLDEDNKAENLYNTGNTRTFHSTRDDPEFDMSKLPSFRYYDDEVVAFLRQAWDEQLKLDAEEEAALPPTTITWSKH